ncbi:hypothetical protein GQ457_01G021850 [Hibiscus cannabinus]
MQHAWWIRGKRVGACSSPSGQWKKGEIFRRAMVDQELTPAAVLRRRGFSIFIDNISKRIHQRTLREAFQEYGIVKDVYIAYNNIKRIHVRLTFAFVRFDSEADARRAIDRAHGRKMDGEKIKVFWAKERQVKERGKKQEQERRKKHEQMRGQPGLWKLKDSRSFKEALLGLGMNTSRVDEEANQRKDGQIESMQQSGTWVRVEDIGHSAGNETIERSTKTFVIQEEEMDWVRHCLVGCIKPMFNEDIVKQAMESDGFPAIICPWFGQTVVLRFPNKKECLKCWSVRDELLRVWFQDLEFLEGFDGKRKVKIWVKLHDVPLSVWNTKFFHKVISRWGDMLDMDEDTKNMNRFDVARFLIQTRRSFIIPERIVVIVNGAVVQVKVSTKQYEEDQVFIDEGFPARDEVAGDCDASDSVEEDDYGGKQIAGPNISTSMENHYVPINVQPLSPTVREQGGHVESLVKANPAGFEGSNLFEISIASANSSELRTTFGPGPKGQLQTTESDGQSISVSHKSRLQEVQVEKAFGSKRKGESQIDGSAIFRRGRPNCLRVNIDRINWRVANSRIRRKSVGGGRKRVEEVWQSGFNFSPRAVSNEIDVGSRKLTMGGYSTLSDAEEVLNLGKNMGVHFVDSDDIVLARLAELETEPRAD